MGPTLRMNLVKSKIIYSSVSKYLSGRGPDPFLFIHSTSQIIILRYIRTGLDKCMGVELEVLFLSV